MVFLSLSHGQDLPECIYDAFPELNKTEEHSSSDFAKLEYPKGFTCDLCVNLLTEIENILEDQTIDDAVNLLIKLSYTYFHWTLFSMICFLI